jgi:FdrA protein
VSVAKVRVRTGTYVDSVRLMTATRTMTQSSGVEWADALMGTSANRDSLEQQGFPAADLADVGANDLVLAVRAATDGDAEAALDEAASALSTAGSDGPAAGSGSRPPRTLVEARAELPITDGTADVAIVSVPGPYAALEAARALSTGMHVLLFSDNVPISDEVALKARAVERGLLLMGPGAGTALLAGTGLGFANVVRPGAVGVVAAAGTGAQEVMALLDQHGAGISSVVGVGGRDLSGAVRGLMTQQAVAALEDDDRTDVILIVSKPADADVVADLVTSLGRTPTVVAFLGLTEKLSTPPGVTVCDSLESAVLATLDLLGVPRPNLSDGLAERAAQAAASLPEQRRAVRGLYSGGTLCYEALVTLSRRLGPVHSNTPLRPDWALPAPPGAHVCLDLGEEEFTRDRPHPMIDAEARSERIVAEGSDRDTAAVLIDVVLGAGAHDDPAGILAPACAQVTAQQEAPAVVAHVLGTDGDPQGLADQCRQLEEAGVLIAPTGARAALLAAAIAARRPDIAAEVP